MSLVGLLRERVIVLDLDAYNCSTLSYDDSSMRVDRLIITVVQP